MLKEKYLNKLKEYIDDLSEKNPDMQAFIFGSSIKKEKFGDVDLGILGEVRDEDLKDLEERFEESTFPYFVDIIDFNEVGEDFKNNVLNNEVLWIKKTKH